MTKRIEPEMAHNQYRWALKRLGLNVSTACVPLGITLRMSQYYASEGKAHIPPPRPISRLLHMYVQHGIPEKFFKK